ncbi:hypothetical protein LXL04_026985 [Taraxacum kok-saghyz]
MIEAARIHGNQKEKRRGGGNCHWRRQSTKTIMKDYTSIDLFSSPSPSHLAVRFLPIANISRIMKKALPANAKMAKDAKEIVQEAISEFISFITSDDKCQKEKRKTISDDDLLWAMGTLGFEDYIEPLIIAIRASQ